MGTGEGQAVATPRIRVGRGARATEELLLADLEALLPSSVADLGLLSRPVVVVVPSRSLRLHLVSRLLERHRRAVAGVEIVTLHGVASEILERCGEAPRASAPLLPVLVQRFARREEALRVRLDPFQDGYAAVLGAVRDLLDAGFEPSHAEALGQLLAERGAGAEHERALALLRTAEAVGSAFEEEGLTLSAHVLRRATDLLRADPERALPARAVLIHGIADATGVATDLVETLLRLHGASVYLDQPPDPVDSSRTDLGVRFGERFFSRLRGVVGPEWHQAAPSTPDLLETFRAPGANAEVREVGQRVRALIEGGAPPERIGVVARDLAPYAAALQVHFNRLGVGFSGVAAAGSRTAAGRRLAGLSELLQRGGEVAAEVWLGTASDLSGFDLRLAVHVCGAGRLRDVASLDLDAFLDGAEGLPLPVRRGLVEVEADGDDPDNGRAIAPRRKVPKKDLRRTVERAAGLVVRLERWPAAAPLSEHITRLGRLLDKDLGWTRDTPGAAQAATTLSRLAGELPVAFDLSREEFFLLVRRELADAGSTRLGGDGGGVQVLSVTEARGRTFAHLFLLGLNRDVFPRPVSEDPLLPDRLRLALTSLLPEIPIKHTGFDEERFLFAQLLSSSPHVTLSYLACDDDGRAQTPSPLVERLRLKPGGGEPPLVSGALAAGGSGSPRPAFEHAVLAGLHETRARFGAVLELACAEAAGESGASEAARLLASARLAILDELDPDRRSAEGRAHAATLGPYFGFVGAARDRSDPRRGEIPVTSAENLAGCPWQVFLRKVLRLEPPPDALAAAPGLDPLLVGSAVHGVLERIVREAVPRLPETLDAAIGAPPTAVAWPGPELFERILQDVCATVARKAGLALPGLGRVLAEQARPFLEVAERLAWAGEEIKVLVVEVAGTVQVTDAAERKRTISFRADRLDESDDGLLFTDFKTGAPYSNAARTGTRHDHFLRAVRQGRALQAAAYAAAAAGRPARGRYLFLRPDLEDDRRTFTVAAEDTDILTAFTAVVQAVLQAWDLGSFFPRLEQPDEPEEPRRCSVCEVRQACLRGDSGARRRLAGWAARHAAGSGGVSPAEIALLAVWRLAAKGEGRPAGEGEEA